MKKKNNKAENNIIQQNITQALELNYMPYAMSVIVSRAIPDIDGFKPSHRKLLYTMYKMNLLTGHRIKSADVVGQTMRLNPHGDAAIYETLVRLTRGNSALLHPFIDSKGNFGKQYSRDMAYAASRYTEVKLDDICNELFKDIDKNTVDFVDNYSATMKEPTIFPTTFPNILVNPNQGIAVGMANCICSFNLAEVCTATIKYIKNNDTSFIKYLLAPDFSTGAQIIYDRKKLEEIYETGRGSFKLRAKYQVKGNLIEIKEIPYTTNIESIIDKVISQIKIGKIKEINDIRDETDINGLKIAIETKKGTNPDILMHKLYSSTPLSDTFSCNFNILINGHPQVLGIGGILEEWTKFRIKCVKRQIEYTITENSKKEHLLIGLSKILLNIDQVIKIIQNTTVEKDVIKNIMQSFNIDELQAEYVVNIKLRNLNKEYILKKISELDNLQKEIHELNLILNDELKIKNIIVNQLKEISKRYGKPRLTEIIYQEEAAFISDDDLIEDYPIKLILTDHNYFKKTVITRTQQEQKIKDDDFIKQELDSSNKNEILMFTDKQNIYKLKAYELTTVKASSLGEFLPNMLNMEDGENVIYMVATNDYSGDIIFLFENGKMAKIKLQSYATKTNRKKLVNAYSNKSKLIFMTHIKKDVDLIIIRNTDKATLFSTGLLQSKTSKISTGIQVYTLKKNSAITKVMLKEDFEADNYEYYRTTKIPTTGRFIKE